MLVIILYAGQWVGTYWMARHHETVSAISSVSIIVSAVSVCLFSLLYMYQSCMWNSIIYIRYSYFSPTAGEIHSATAATGKPHWPQCMLVIFLQVATQGALKTSDKAQK